MTGPSSAVSTGTGVLLSVADLSVDYGTVPAVVGVGFDVGPGQVVALVGESGSGKTTTALAVAGLLPPSAVVRSGRILYEGGELLTRSESDLRAMRGRTIGFVPQDPGVSLDPTQRVGRQVAEALEVHGLANRPESDRRAVQLLLATGLSDPARRAQQYPHQLSGGMRQRVLIAMALACEPRLVIADEPTSALDVTVQRQVLDLLDQLRAEHSTAVLLVTHDLAVAADRADRIVVMSGGRVVENGPVAQVLSDPQHAYTQRLLSSTPARRRSAPSSRVPVDEGAVTASAASESGPAIVQARHLVKEFPSRGDDQGRRHFRAVDDVSFDIPRGRTFALVGESGSGKSTTARMVMGLETPTAGTVSFDGVELDALSRRELRLLRQRFQLIQQNPYSSLNPRWSVGRIITEPLRAFGGGNRAERGVRARELLDQVRLPVDYARRRPAELSGGQRQRVAIARALALRPDLVVCDEPISALDVSVQAQILELLGELQRELHLSYLFISHDLSVVRLIADELAVMRHGVIMESGATATVFATPATDYTRELLDAIPGDGIFV
jgi:peptide/nickel transport system ATP-binding protein